MTTSLVSVHNDDAFAAYNATVFDDEENNDFFSNSKSMLTVFACICLWVLAIGFSIHRNFRQVAAIGERNLLRETKIERAHQDRRKNTILSILLLRRITKIDNQGGVEFSESKDFAQQEASTKFVLSPNLDQSNTSTDGKNDPCIDVGDDNSLTVNSEKEHTDFTKKPVDEDAPLKETDYHVDEESRERAITDTKKVSVQKDNNQEDQCLGIDCSVCLNHFNVGDELAWSRKLKCQHVFHSDCLIPWLMKHEECPVCRTKLIDDEDLLDNEISEEGSIASTGDGEASTTAEISIVSIGNEEVSTTAHDEESNVSPSGSFFVANGLVSFVRNTHYTRVLSQTVESINHDPHIETNDSERHDGLIEMMTST